LIAAEKIYAESAQREGIDYAREYRIIFNYLNNINL